MKHWFTSDHHFEHEAIISYCGRPFKSVAHMDMELVRRWNERVKIGDVVYHLGDFKFRRRRDEGGRNYSYYADQLNGHIIQFRGNHDRGNDVKSILTEGVINHGGIDWHMEHEPKAKFVYNLCGHVHEHWRISRRGKHIIVNVGVDAWDFYPINIQEILEAVVKKRDSVY